MKKLLTISFSIILLVLITPAFAEKMENGSISGVHYKFTGGKVKQIMHDSYGLLVSMDAIYDGTLTLKIPKKTWHAANSDCTYSSLLILVDGQEANYKNDEILDRIHSSIWYFEKLTPFGRTLQIDIPEGSSQVELVYTFTSDSSPTAWDYGKQCIENQLPPPKKQIERGMSLLQIKCDKGFELVFKKSNGNPVCVYPETAKKLIERGWGSKLETMRDSKTPIELLDKKYTLQANGDIFEIRYLVIGSQLREITVDHNARSFIVNLENSEKGHMIIELPRKLIDAQIGPGGKSGEDVDFFVLINGSEVDFEETSSIVARTLTIPLENDSSQIEIIGTLSNH